MSIDKNLQVARMWFEQLWSMPDLEIAYEIIAADYDPDWVQIPVKGPDQVKHEIKYFRSIFPDLVYEIVDIVAFEDRVWVRYRGCGTQKGNAWGFEATDKNTSFEGITIFTFNQEGQISDRWGAFCFYDLFAELGLVPPIWELSKHFPKEQ